MHLKVFSSLYAMEAEFPQNKNPVEWEDTLAWLVSAKTLPSSPPYPPQPQAVLSQFFFSILEPSPEQANVWLNLFS